MDGKNFAMSGSPTSVLENGAFKDSSKDPEAFQGYLAQKGYDQSGVGETEDKDKELYDLDDPRTTDELGNEEDFTYMADLEARAAVRFNKMTFFKETIYHTFYPLSAPLMYYLDGGYLALTNRSFLGWENRYLVMSQLFWAINFYLVNVMSFIYIVKSRHDLDFLYDVFAVDLLWLMRNLVVATKYAFLSKVEMEEMQTKRIPPYVHRYRTLLAAWKDPIPSRILKHELLLSALRNKLMFKKIAFSLDSNVDSTQAVRDLILDLRLAKTDFNNVRPCLLRTLPIYAGVYFSVFKRWFCASIWTFVEVCKTSEKSLSFSYGKRAHNWLQLGLEQLGDPLAWAEGGGSAKVDRLPARLYAAHVIRQGSSLSRLSRLGHTLLSQHLGKCCIILGLAHAVIPAIGRFAFGGHKIPGPPYVAYCVLIPSFLLVTFSMISNVAFLMIGVLDFRRRHFYARSLDEILRTGVYTGTHHVRTSSLKNKSVSKSGPFSDWLRYFIPSSNAEFSSRSGSSGTLSGEGIFFNFSTLDSLFAWWTCRQLLSNFGYGFYKRIKYCTTYFAGYCVILLVFLVLKTLTGIRKSDFYLLITVIFSINVFLTLLALMVWPGGDTNYLLQQHASTLIRKKIRMQMIRIKTGKHLNTDEEKRISRAPIDTINSIVEAVKWDNNRTKLSICGFEAREQLVSLIVAVVTASISIGIGQIVQNGFTM